MGLAQGPPTADQSRQFKKAGRSSPSASLPRSPFPSKPYTVSPSSRPFLPATPPLRLPLHGQGSPPPRHGTNFRFLNLFQLPRRHGCPWPAPRLSCPHEAIRIIFAPEPKKLPGPNAPLPPHSRTVPTLVFKRRTAESCKGAKKEGGGPACPRPPPGETLAPPLRSPCIKQERGFPYSPPFFPLNAQCKVWGQLPRIPSCGCGGSGGVRLRRAALSPFFSFPLSGSECGGRGTQLGHSLHC